MGQRVTGRPMRLACSLLLLGLAPLACNKGRYSDQMAGNTGTMASPPGGVGSESANPPANATDTAETAKAPDTSTGAATAPAMGKGSGSGNVSLGGQIFHGKAAGGTCFTCHGQDAKGTTLAPDLTDNQWLNTDGSQQGIAQIVTNGVPQPKQHQAGMPPMGGAKLTPDQIQAVAAYVYSLSHSH